MLTRGQYIFLPICLPLPDTMKKYFYCMLLLSSLGTLYAQSENQNYVKETIYRRPADINGIYVLNSNQHYITTTYTDGLGRPIQRIQEGMSPDESKKIVTHIEYEKNIGQTRQYLPFTETGKIEIGTVELPFTLYNSDYVENAKQKTHTFYSSQKYEYTPNPYSENRLERAPAQRVLESSAPGRDWHMELGEHTIKYSYDFNHRDKEAVYKLEMDTYWDEDYGLYRNKIGIRDTYAHNSLHKTIIKNENWKPEDGLDNTTEEFKRVDGKVVLKRIYNRQDPHDTYYLYDRFGNLVYVLSPEGESLLNQEKIDLLGYQYLYDHKNRLAAKKLPGKEWEYIVYDKADRIVMTGPVHNPFGEEESGWLVSKYDIFNRVVYTGFHIAKISFESRKDLQDIINSQDPINEHKTTSGSIDNQTVWYSNDLYPNDLRLLTFNYYDDYAFPDAPTQFPVVQGTPTQTAVKGLATGSWTRILQSSNDYAADRSYTLYDVRYRPLRVFTQNYLGGFTQNDHTYSFTGQVLSTITTHQRTASAAPLTIADTYTYDNRDRLLSHSQSVNGAAAQRIAENSYDELGALSLKKVGGLLSASEPLQRVSHTYNIRGWLKQINPSYLHFADEGSNTLFGYELNYNTSEYMIGAPYQYNGNINSVRWRTATDNQTRGTEFRYDKLNRLGESTMLRYNYNESPRAGYFEPIDAYGERLSYDKNGNIQRLLRTGQEVNGQTLDLDDLIYRYHGNQLTEVTDQTNNPDGFHDGHTDGRDYEYDKLGNMIIDRNKDILNIRYNHLNLPLEINIKDHGIRYLYDANGTKVAKIVKTDEGEKTTDYLGGFQYYENELQFFPTEEGYVYPKDKKEYLYVYQYKDHLGNIRLSYQDINGDGSIQPTEILEENNYYPFGLKQEGYNDLSSPHPFYKYTYVGQEFQDDWGLNMTAMDFRQYDQALGRFNVMDALSEMAYDQTPYRYGFNNPVFWKDPSGLFETEKQAAKFLSDNGLNGSITYNQDFNGYVVTVQGGEFDGTQFYDFSEVMGNMVIETTSKRGGGSNGNENGTLVSLFQEPGKKVMESKNSFLGKLWFTLEPREWTDVETNLTYQVNADGTIKGIRPLGGLGVLGFVNGAGTLKTAKNTMTLTEQSAAISKKLGKNSITLSTSTKQIRFDLVGKAHGNVPTPHMQVYNKNFVDGVQKSVSRASKDAIPMTQQEIRMIRKYIDKLGN
ncbi:DUF6443 domain-containing protein [Myroides ceti]|uniref:DUF6443 domain-containing protein n=1 Tax=Paenimyroides ceti TaxID=395087 RepID=A0ABT8CVG2_9FLAO|nr:DUF6443 domain-containing protein [Paenimyroides ceti]MDN3708425.1 DUF6443 domain-containing protein [Paenimyroides ceti]